MTATARRVATIAVLGALGLGACRSDGRDMQTPRFPPPAPTTSTTLVPTGESPTG